MKRIFFPIAVLVFAFLVVPVHAEEYSPNEVVVKFRKGAPRPALAFQSGEMKTFGIGRATERARKFTDAMEDYAVIKLSPGISVESAVAALQSLGNIEYASPNYRVRAEAVPNDTNFSQQWGMRNTGQTVQGVAGVSDADIDATEAWDVVTGSASVVVAVIDSGIDYTHPDLSGNLWINPGEIASNGIDDDANGIIDDRHGANFDRISGAPLGDNLDSYHHGTHVAGILGATGNNNRGVAGVAWTTKIMALRFLDSGGNGTVAHAVEAIEYATEMGASVINNSWSTTANDSFLRAAIVAARDAGIVVTAAAGNDSGSTTIMYPAGWSEVIAVSATNNLDANLTLNQGAHIDLGAPGKDVGSTYPSNQYAYLSGTSMATPHVSGVAALMKSISPSITPAQVLTILKASVDVPSGWNFNYGVGRLNAYTAVQSVGDAAPPTVSLTAPDGSEPVNGASVALTATAADDKVVTKVWFIVNNVVISTDTTSPYSTTWDSTSVSDGAHTIVARAFDGAGNVTSSTRTITVGNADTVRPSVSITSPANAATILGTTTINVSASDNVAVSKVWFFLDGVLMSTDTTSAYSWDLDTLTTSNGSHTLMARAFDMIGNSSSTSIVVTVNNPDISSPTVSVTAPANGAQLEGNISFSANAIDNIGVTSVTFLVDGVVIATDTTSPYSISLNTGDYATGSRALTARAFDAAGNSSSHTVTVTFQDSPSDTTPPSISVPGLASGMTINGIVLLKPETSDNFSVVKVELHVDNVLLESDFSSPFEFSLNTAALGTGTHSILLKAFDAAGNVGLTTANVIVGGFSISPFHPVFNPARGEAMTIPINVGEPKRVVARLLDRFGAVVVTLFDGDLAPGQNLSWDGRNAGRDLAASGVYVLYLDIGGKVETRKIVVRK